MSVKTKAGQIWTDSVAYVALVLGAGVSIAGNVANVNRVRGDQTDALDLFMAGFFPGLVVLMVEVFVSARWRGLNWPMQVLRWAGCGAVTIVAMRVSWVHLHALMVSRQQEADVAILGPLAIDFLAIMATALILAGRGQTRPAGRMVFDHLAPIGPMPPVAPAARRETVSEILDREAARTAVPSLADEAQSYLDRLGAELDATTTAAHPVSPAPLTNTVKPESVPDEAARLILAWGVADRAVRPREGQADALIAAEFGVTPRSARRWRTSLIPSEKV
jgi:hypothetical protein